MGDRTEQAFTRARQQYESGDLDGMIATLTKIIEQDPSGMAYFDRGRAYAGKHNYGAAIADADKAFELQFPARADLYCLRGCAHAGNGDFGKSIADHTEAIKLDPKIGYYDNRAYAKLRVADLDGAIADYTKGIELDPTGANSYYNRGLAYRDKGSPREAIADWEKAMQLDPAYRARVETLIRNLSENRK